MKTIVLSAGHGGSDPGAVGNGLRESDLNLTICLACRDYLNNNYTGHQLILPRNKDVYVSLPARRNLTQNEGADLYVSMHNNAASNPAGRGFETFTHSGPLFASTLKYQSILHDTVYAFLRDYSVPDRGKKRFDHWVTRMMPCPTVLMEYLFVTNPQDAALMKRIGFLEKLGELTGEGIAQALHLPRKIAIEPEPDGQWYRVIAGSYRSRANAEIVVELLKSQGISAFIDIHKGG